MSDSDLQDLMPGVKNKTETWGDPLPARLRAAALARAQARREAESAARDAAEALVHEGYGDRITRESLADLDAASPVKLGEARIGAIVHDVIKALEAQGSRPW